MAREDRITYLLYAMFALILALVVVNSARAEGDLWSSGTNTFAPITFNGTPDTRELLRFKASTLTIQCGSNGKVEVSLETGNATFTNCNLDEATKGLWNGIKINFEQSIKDRCDNSHSEKLHIEDLVKKGLICELYGHQWSTPLHINAVYCPEGCPQKRTCRVCGKSQVEQRGWKDTQ